MKNKIIYKKGTRVIINVKGDIRYATIEKDVYDLEQKVRVQIDGYPMPISIKQSEIMP